jgi:hypothetical protein
MTPDEAAIRLREVIGRECEGGHEWMVGLDEFDEPPLFSRCEDVAFLSQIDGSQRGIVLMKCAIEESDRAADFLAGIENREHYFVCLTVLDWELVAEGAQPVPTPCLFVSPRAELELATFECLRPLTPEGLAVERWVESLGRADLCVGETISHGEDEGLRIYVGYVRGRGFKSLGDFMRSSRPGDSQR